MKQEQSGHDRKTVLIVDKGGYFAHQDAYIKNLSFCQFYNLE